MGLGDETTGGNQVNGVGAGASTMLTSPCNRQPRHAGNAQPHGEARGVLVRSSADPRTAQQINQDNWIALAWVAVFVWLVIWLG